MPHVPQSGASPNLDIESVGLGRHPLWQFVMARDATMVYAVAHHRGFLDVRASMVPAKEHFQGALKYHPAAQLLLQASAQSW